MRAVAWRALVAVAVLALTLAGLGRALAQRPSGVDLDVTYIEMVRPDGTRWSIDDPNGGWPRRGEAVLFRGHVLNQGDQAAGPFTVAWSIDGSLVQSAPAAGLAAASALTPTLQWTWPMTTTADGRIVKRHTLRLAVALDDAHSEVSLTNNAVEDTIGGLAVGLWVEQSVYDFYNQNQFANCVGQRCQGSNSFEDWAQRNLRHWNEMLADATPTLLDRVRLDKLVVVPDRTLPLTALPDRKPSNTPDASDAEGVGSKAVTCQLPDSPRARSTTCGTNDWTMGLWWARKCQASSLWQEVGMATISDQTGWKGYVFISYAHEDLDFVQGLAARLEEAGVPTWYDRGLRGGSTWPKELAARLDKVMACVAIWSPHAALSDWVQEEMFYAREKAKIPVVPVWWRECDLPFGFTRTQYVDYRNGRDGFADLIEALGTGTPTDVAPNPFHPTSGRIEDPARVFDREHEVRRALGWLESGSSVGLIGPEGVGKSSLLTKLLSLAPTRLRLAETPLYLNLLNILNQEQLYKALCQVLGVANCQGPALVDALRGRHVLLCIDEIGKLAAEGFSRGLRDQLRGLAEAESAPLRLVVAARVPLDRLFADSDKTSPFSGVCIQVDVPPWDEATSTAFLQNRLAGTGVAFSADQVSDLLRSSGGRPRDLVRLAHNLYAELTGGGR